MDMNQILHQSAQLMQQASDHLDRALLSLKEDGPVQEEALSEIHRTICDLKTVQTSLLTESRQWLPEEEDPACPAGREQTLDMLRQILSLQSQDPHYAEALEPFFEELRAFLLDTDHPERIDNVDTASFSLILRAVHEGNPLPDALADAIRLSLGFLPYTFITGLLEGKYVLPDYPSVTAEQEDAAVTEEDHGEAPASEDAEKSPDASEERSDSCPAVPEEEEPALQEDSEAETENTAPVQPATPEDSAAPVEDTAEASSTLAEESCCEQEICAEACTGSDGAGEDSVSDMPDASPDSETETTIEETIPDPDDTGDLSGEADPSRVPEDPCCHDTPEKKEDPEDILCTAPEEVSGEPEVFLHPEAPVHTGKLPSEKKMRDLIRAVGSVLSYLLSTLSSRGLLCEEEILQDLAREHMTEQSVSSMLGTLLYKGYLSTYLYEGKRYYCFTEMMADCITSPSLSELIRSIFELPSLDRPAVTAKDDMPLSTFLKYRKG